MNLLRFPLAVRIERERHVNPSALCERLMLCKQIGKTNGPAPQETAQVLGKVEIGYRLFA